MTLSLNCNFSSISISFLNAATALGGWSAMLTVFKASRLAFSKSNTCSTYTKQTFRSGSIRGHVLHVYQLRDQHKKVIIYTYLSLLSATYSNLLCT